MWARIKAAQFEFSRKILFSWIKPTILGCNRESLGLTDNDLICYALPHQSLTDLLVVETACLWNNMPVPTGPIPEIDERRSMFFLGRPEGRFGRRSLRQQSARMTRLFDHQTNDHHKRNIVIVPVSLFWGHQPEREKSMFKLIFSENWSATGRFKKFMAALIHPNHILVQFGTPIQLVDLIDREEDRALQIRKLHRLLRVHFNQQKQAILGPDLSHRRTLLNTILSAEEVRSAIEREAKHEGQSVVNVEKKAMSYAREIASDQSYRVIRFFHVLLTWLWNNLYDGIEVNGIDKAKELAQSHEVVYTPCHRSHIDYLLLSYVLYHNGLTPPHIAAGRNLNLPVIGGFLRRAGAFYMRRTFQGDPLYKVIFDEYLHQMFTKGYSVEYFIEGGRSRTGRTLTPRTGMLSMTVRSFQKDSTKPIAFLPVYFGYERVIESSTYMAELAGRDKKSESVFDVFKIFSSFRHAFGKVTVNFGTPVLLKEFLDVELRGWRTNPEMSGGAFSRSCVELGRRLATNINSAVAVKPTNLVALAILSTTRQTIEEAHLKQQITLLRELTRLYHPTCSVVDWPAQAILEEAIRIFGLSRTSHKFGVIVSATPQQAITMTYNANGVLHVFSLPSLIARFVRTKGNCRHAEVAKFLGVIFPYVASEMFLAVDETNLESELEKVINELIRLKLLVSNGKEIRTPTPDTAEYQSLHELASSTDPTLERFYIVMALLRRDPEPSSKQLEKAAAGIAEQLSVIFGINSPDFFERSLFSSFVATMKRENLIAAQDTSLTRRQGFDLLEENIALTIGPDVRYHILQAVKNGGELLPKIAKINQTA